MAWRGVWVGNPAGPAAFELYCNTSDACCGGTTSAPGAPAGAVGASSNTRRWRPLCMESPVCHKNTRLSMQPAVASDSTAGAAGSGEEYTGAESGVSTVLQVVLCSSCVCGVVCMHAHDAHMCQQPQVRTGLQVSQPMAVDHTAMHGPSPVQSSQSV